MGSLFAIIFFISFITVGAIFLLEKAKYEKHTNELNNKISEKITANEKLTELCRELEKYQPIVDINSELEAVRQRILTERSTAQDSIDQLNARQRQLDAEYETATQQHKSELRKMRKEATVEQNNILNRASDESSRILSEANRRAEEIAGDAYRALKESQHLEETVKAIQNTIRGYGDAYLIPNHAALDDLADNYTHKQAGMDLKTARAATRVMVENQIAATCDYAEKRRSETAVKFVLDAFNGKVDSSMSTVRDNNFGKLQQEIIDAFHIVNEHGKAFRNARILPEYLDARLNELKCAVAVMELKTAEQEEQRRIKQEIREENKAKAEYQKAIKEAEKEEKLLQRLMEEARKKLETATETQRAEYEAKIAELQQKYTDAEERNRRAISMAQQTRRGHVYVISNVGSFGEDVFKIGLTRRLEPLERVKELGDASVPFEFDVHAMIYNEDAPKLEKTLHQIFVDYQVNKINPRKEFFRVGVTEIREALAKIGIEAKWTLKSEAKEYRETLAIERESGFQKTIKDPDPDVAEILASSEATPPTLEIEPLHYSSADPILANGLGQDGNGAVQQDTPTLAGATDTADGGNKTAANPQQIKDRTARCPHADCGGIIPFNTLKMGDNQCPHCDRQFTMGKKNQ